MIHALALAGAVAVAKPKPPPWVDVGTRRLFRCRPSDSGVSVPGYCDVLRVPLDWREPSLGTIAVRYQWIPARDGGAAQTIVALDGGRGSRRRPTATATFGCSAPCCANETCS